MQEVRVATNAHYQANEDNFKERFQRFFDRIDYGFNQRVSYRDFENTLKERGRNCTSQAFFNQLDKDKDGFLDEEDVRVLFYLMETRNDCSACGDLIITVYYTCIACFDDCKDIPCSPMYNLCSSCYHGNKYTHEHQAFVDNYFLLIKRRFPQTDWGTLKNDMFAAAGVGLAIGLAKGTWKERDAVIEGLGLNGHEDLPQEGVKEVANQIDLAGEATQEVSSNIFSSALDFFSNFM